MRTPFSISSKHCADHGASVFKLLECGRYNYSDPMTNCPGLEALQSCCKSMHSWQQAGVVPCQARFPHSYFRLGIKLRSHVSPPLGIPEQCGGAPQRGWTSWRVLRVDLCLYICLESSSARVTLAGRGWLALSNFVIELHAIDCHHCGPLWLSLCAVRLDRSVPVV